MDPYDFSFLNKNVLDVFSKWLIHFAFKEYRDVKPIDVRRLCEELGKIKTKNQIKKFKRKKIILNIRSKYIKATKDAQRSPEHPACVGREKLIHYYLKGPVLLDLGCGNQSFARNVIKNSQIVTTAIGVDVDRKQQGKKHEEPAVFFIKAIEGNNYIPINTLSAHTVTLLYTLHHLQDINLAPYLREVRRVLAKDGVVCVLEDSWDDSKKNACSVISKEKGIDEIEIGFRGLEYDEKIKFYCIADQFTHQFLQPYRPDFKVPGSYHSISEWEKLFNNAGFVAIHLQDLGFCAAGSRMPVCRALMIFVKHDDVGGIKRLSEL